MDSIIIFILIAFLVELIIIFFVLRYEILSFIFPQKYYYSFLISKGNLVGKWNKYPDGLIHNQNGFQYKINSKKAIRKSNVNCYVWLEGVREPLDFSEEQGFNIDIKKSISKIEVMSMFSEDLSFGQQMIDQIIKALPLIIIAAFFIYMFLNGNNP